MKHTITTPPQSPSIEKGMLVNTCGIIGIVTKIESNRAEVVSIIDFENKHSKRVAGDILLVKLDNLSVFKASITLSN